MLNNFKNYLNIFVHDFQTLFARYKPKIRFRDILNNHRSKCLHN